MVDEVAGIASREINKEGELVACCLLLLERLSETPVQKGFAPVPRKIKRVVRRSEEHLWR
jgi:hypothetical protein